MAKRKNIIPWTIDDSVCLPIPKRTPLSNTDLARFRKDCASGKASKDLVEASAFQLHAKGWKLSKKGWTKKSMHISSFAAFVCFRNECALWAATVAMATCYRNIGDTDSEKGADALIQAVTAGYRYAEFSAYTSKVFNNGRPKKIDQQYHALDLAAKKCLEANPESSKLPRATVLRAAYDKELSSDKSLSKKRFANLVRDWRIDRGIVKI